MVTGAFTPRFSASCKFFVLTVPEHTACARVMLCSLQSAKGALTFFQWKEATKTKRMFQRCSTEQVGYVHFAAIFVPHGKGRAIAP